MTILDKIIAFKKKEVAKIKADVPVEKLVTGMFRAKYKNLSEY